MSTNDGTKGTIFDKGSWQHTLNASARLYDKSGTDRKKAGTYLWQGATSAIAEWNADPGEDTKAESLYAEMIGIMGEHRKGDVSKIKTVALAVREHDLDLSQYNNLSKAYGEARRLMVVVQQEKDEDNVADEVIESIAEAAPKTATSATSAALILLSKGIDGAVVAILDALNGPAGEHNPQAHRAFMRAVSTEVSARVAAVAQAEKEAAAAARAKAREEAKAKTGDGATKGKTKAKPASEKAKAASDALKAKAEEKGVTPDEHPTEERDDLDDLLDEVEDEEAEVEEAEVEEAETAEDDQEDEVTEAPAAEAPAAPRKRAAVRRPRR